MKTIFYDIDTQNDFMNPDGALYVPDAELIKPNLALLTKFAKENFLPVAGSVDRHFGTEEYKERELELARWDGPFPDHCMDQKYGERKIHETTLQEASSWEDENSSNGYDCGDYIENSPYPLYPEKPIPKEIIDLWEIFRKEREKNRSTETLESCWKKMRTGIDNSLINSSVGEIHLVLEKKQRPRGIYFEKQSYDVFTNPAIEFALKKAEVQEAVVYGVATDYCVKAAVLGMHTRGIQTYVVEDAIKGVAPQTTQKALEEMAAAGAKFVTTKDVLGGRK